MTISSMDHTTVNRDNFINGLYHCTVADRTLYDTEKDRSTSPYLLITKLSHYLWGRS